MKTNGRYTSAPSPTAVGFNTNVQYGTQSNGTSGYEGTHGSTSVDDLTMGLRGMAVGDDYGSQNSSYRQGTSMPQPQTAPPPVRGPHMIQAHQARPSYGGYNPQGDYSAYYAGPSGLDYSFSYDTYRSNSDASCTCKRSRGNLNQRSAFGRHDNHAVQVLRRESMRPPDETATGRTDDCVEVQV